MTKFLPALAFLALLAFPAAAEDAPIPDRPSPAASAFVAQFSDAHLGTMLKRIGSRQQPMVALSQLHGQMLAAIYDAEVAKSVAKYGPEWQDNMARAWTGLLTDEELTSLFEDGATSPHTEKYKTLSTTAGQRMQTLSRDRFRAILSETIQNTMKVLAEPAGDDGETSGDGSKDSEPAAKDN